MGERSRKQCRRPTAGVIWIALLGLSAGMAMGCQVPETLPELTEVGNASPTFTPMVGTATPEPMRTVSGSTASTPTAGTPTPETTQAGEVSPILSRTAGAATPKPTQAVQAGPTRAATPNRPQATVPPGQRTIPLELGWYTSGDSVPLITSHATHSVSLLIHYYCGDYTPFLDTIAGYGISAFIQVDPKWVQQSNPADIRAFVQRYREHPALEGWYLSTMSPMPICGWHRKCSRRPTTRSRKAIRRSPKGRSSR